MHTTTTSTAKTGQRGSTVAVAVAVLLACLGAADPVLAEPALTDQQITDAIEDELAYDKSVLLNDIDVHTTSGITTLTGTVSNILAKERAAQLAETVKGVRAVINRIDVKPYWGRMDWEIEADVEQALMADPATESWEVNAEVRDNTVHLTGTVGSWHESMLAERVVKGVRGVAAVDNELSIDYDEARPDVEIREEVEHALRWDGLVDHALIDVRVSSGKVELSGKVGSAAEKRRAERDAWVFGTESVNAEKLTVDPAIHDETQREREYVVQSEDEVREAIKDALIYDPRVYSFDVNVDVIGSAVTLRGQVDNLKAKRAAAQVARRTRGVAAVTNRIRVRPDVTNDMAIERDIRNAIARDPYVERYEIDVEVMGGSARLSGTVDSYFEKGRAEDIAAKTAGVTAVRNGLEVDVPESWIAYDPYVYDYYPYDYTWYDYAPYVTFRSDREIRQDIKSEFWWSPFLDGDDVTVKVESGVATLTGTVGSWSEREDATENAFEGGAVWVDNNLMVE